MNNLRQRKTQNTKTMKNNYSVTKKFWKSKHSLQKNSYYRTTKNPTSKTVIQTEKVSKVSSDKSSKSAWYKRKKVKTKGFVSLYNVEIVNPFNPEVQLKQTESAIKNKLEKIIHLFQRI